MRPIILFFSITIFGGVFSSCDTTKEQPKTSIFSWSKEEIIDHQEELISDLIHYKFNRIFQSFSNEVSDEDIISYVLALTKHNIDVYSLAGTPEWALDGTGEGMIRQIERISYINSQLPKKQQIKGLVIDVEPYTLNNFDWEDHLIQQSFILGMKQLYEVANKEGLELIVVVPYFYDTKGYDEVLSIFIHEASSEVAVMNYYKNHEIEHLSFEAIEAKKANKPLTTIYEFKRPGEHRLTEKNTYYNDGLQAVQENGRRLLNHYKSQEINIAYHDYKAFKEVIQRD